MSKFKHFRGVLIFILLGATANAFAADADVSINFNNQTGLFLSRLADEKDQFGKGFWCPALSDLNPGTDNAGLTGRPCGQGLSGPSFARNVTYGLKNEPQQCVFNIQWTNTSTPEPPSNPCANKNIQVFVAEAGGMKCVVTTEKQVRADQCVVIVKVNIH